MTPYFDSDGLTLYHGDCLEIMASFPSESFGAVIADPPYGINTKSDGNGKLSPWADLCNSAYWYSAWLRECRRLLKPDGSLWTCLNWRSLVTFQKASCDIGWSIESLLVWDKCWIGPAGPRQLRPSYELVAMFAMPDYKLADRCAADVQRFMWSSHKPNGHPAEKPIELMQFCLKHGLPAEGGAVLDPFMGSGTTGAACVKAGAPFVGIELDENYCRLASERISPRMPLFA